MTRAIRFSTRVYIRKKDRRGYKDYIIKIPVTVARELGLGHKDSVIVTIEKVGK